MAEQRSPTRQQPFTLENIPQIDSGKIAVAVNQAIRQAAQDVIDRPGEAKPRKVTLTIELTPTLEKETGKLDTIDPQFKVDCKSPTRQSQPYPMQPVGETGMYFRPESPNDPRQMDLYTTPQTDAPTHADRDEHEPTSDQGAS